MPRPVWQNEIIGDIGGDSEPQYDISVDGSVSMENAKLTFKNPILQEGTPHNADNMNNFFDMDNLDSMRGNTRTTTFSADGSTTEEIADNTTGIVNAIRVTVFNADGSITATTTVYTDDGQIVLRESAVTTSFPSGSTIQEEVV